jgi:hypothetical protein
MAGINNDRLGVLEILHSALWAFFADTMFMAACYGGSFATTYTLKLLV